MNKKHLFFSLGAALILACAGAIAFAPKNMEVAKATDYGTFIFEGPNNDSTVNCMYGINWTTNDLPAGWDTTPFAPVDDNSGTFVEGVRKGTEIKKITAYAYYIPVTGATVGTVATVKGTWSNGTDTFTVEEFTREWDGSHWIEKFVMPELEPYDRISLNQFSSDSYDRTPINTEGDTSAWNTWTPSADNPHNNFAFEFEFEAYGSMAGDLCFRIGGSGAWDTPHFYRLVMNNTWGTYSKGAILFQEMQNATVVHNSGDIVVDLSAGSRHVIECGSIVVKDSTKIYHYVKYDGEYCYQEVFTPKTLERTSRLSIYCGLANIYVGNTINQKENDVSFTFNHSGGKDGIYLYGPTNDIPVITGWGSRGVPASKYNMYQNEQVLSNSLYGKLGPLVKISENEYYVSLSTKDYSDINLKVGDVISIGGEFHFYISGKAYTMAVIPFSLEYTGNDFTYIGTMDEYLSNVMDEYVIFDLYDDDKIDTLNGIISGTATNVANANTIKDKWAALNAGKDAIDEVPMNEEKAQELLNQTKQKAIEELQAYDDDTLYDVDELAIVQSYIIAAVNSINEATTIQQVKAILENTKTQIAGVITRQESIENKILSLVDNYEQYLATSDVITTSDLCAGSAIAFYSKDSEEESYGTPTGPDSIYGRFATNSENEEGNVAFKFNYASTNPSSNKYGSQVFIRMRGDAANCYLFSLAKKEADGTYVSLARFVGDAITSEKKYKVDFEPDTEYEMECGSINLKDYDRVFLYIKVNGAIVAKDIVDPIPVPHAPTIIFMDSYTADGSGETVTLIPNETGTTKNTIATSLGRLVLNQNSNVDSLTATLRKNNIPVGAELHPIEENAYKYNYQEVLSYRIGPMIKKVSETQYTISFAGHTVLDEDLITIDGCFAYFDQDALVKHAVKFNKTVFTYHEASNSWSQSAPTLEEAKLEAIDYLNDYVVLEAYSDENKVKIQNIIDQYTTSINNAASNEEVEQLLNQAINAINNIPTILGSYKKAAKEELNAYKSPALFRQEEKDQLNSILQDAFMKIDACNDKDSVDYIVLITKQAIDNLKTAAEYDAEELASEKRTAKAEIETYIGLLEMNRYSDENAALIQQLALKARSDVDAATSKDEIRQIVNTFKQAIKDVATKDGSTFDGEKYIENGKTENKSKKWCGGVIAASSSIIFMTSLIGVVLMIRKRKSNLVK